MHTRALQSTALILGALALAFGVFYLTQQSSGHPPRTPPGEISVRVVNNSNATIMLYHTNADDFDPSSITEPQRDFILQAQPGFEHVLTSSKTTDGVTNPRHTLPITLWTPPATPQASPEPTSLTIAPGHWTLALSQTDDGRIAFDLTERPDTDHGSLAP